ncbi:MAG: hypothetical protein NVSMB13_03860 [Mycobacteriales bacterium]
MLHDEASGHAVDAVFDLLRGADGDFAFVVDEPNPDDLGASMSVEDVVAEGRRRLEIWPALVQSIPSSDAVLSVALSPPEDLSLSGTEWALLAIIDGQRSVADLVAISGRGEFGVVETLAALVERGLVFVRREGAEPEGVSQLLTRQAALAAYEAALAGIPLQITVEPEPEPAPVPRDVPAAGAGDEPADEPVADTASAPAAAPPVERRYQEPTDVTPARPEPFLPRRRPDHPEEPKVPAARQPAGPMGIPVASASRPGAPGSGGARREAVVQGTSAVADPEPLSSYVERDPSVNKSLLLRLIAGVRGL